MNHTVTLARGFDKSFKQPSGRTRHGVDWAIEIAGAHTGMVVVRTYFTSNPPAEEEKRALAEKAVRFVERKMAEGYLPWPDVLEYEEEWSNRVAGRIDLPAPTPPDMRVRVRRFLAVPKD